MMLAEQAGFWTISQNMRFQVKPKDGPTTLTVVRNDLAVEIVFKDGGALSLRCAYLSKPGRDLLSITETQFDFAAFAKIVQKHPGVDGIKAKRCIVTPDGWSVLDMEVKFEAK